MVLVRFSIMRVLGLFMLFHLRGGKRLPESPFRGVVSLAGIGHGSIYTRAMGKCDTLGLELVPTPKEFSVVKHFA